MSAAAVKCIISGITGALGKIRNMRFLLVFGSLGRSPLSREDLLKDTLTRLGAQPQYSMDQLFRHDCTCLAQAVDNNQHHMHLHYGHIWAHWPRVWLLLVRYQLDRARSCQCRHLSGRVCVAAIFRAAHDEAATPEMLAVECLPHRYIHQRQGG